MGNDHRQQIYGGQEADSVRTDADCLGEWAADNAIDEVQARYERLYAAMYYEHGSMKHKAAENWQAFHDACKSAGYDDRCLQRWQNMAYRGRLNGGPSLAIAS